MDLKTKAKLRLLQSLGKTAYLGESMQIFWNKEKNKVAEQKKRKWKVEGNVQKSRGQGP